MPKLSLKQVDNIVFIHAYRAKLPPHTHPYFDWWVDMVSTKQYKVPEYYEGWHGEVANDEFPPELRNTQVEKEEEDVYY